MRAGTTWGLGGTCVNVGCIPKKLMHHAAQAGEGLRDAPAYGWDVGRGSGRGVDDDDDKPRALRHSWRRLRGAVNDHVRSLNWGHRSALMEAGVKYLNALGTFVGPHTLRTRDTKGREKEITAARFVVAVGGRPRYLEQPGFRELAITSDDMFTLPRRPGKTLVVGASYVALECAGFLHAFGYDTTVLVRSRVLRDFDREMGTKVAAFMERSGVRFVYGATPVSAEALDGASDDDGDSSDEEGDASNGKRLSVRYRLADGEEVAETFDTVLLAVGRDPVTEGLGLDAAGVQVDPASGKIVSAQQVLDARGGDAPPPAAAASQLDPEQTSASHIYAIGDVLHGRPELTPVAIHAGKLLARRLFGGDAHKGPHAYMDYDNVATAVFTPMEYGCVGLSEEDAIARYGGAKSADSGAGDGEGATGAEHYDGIDVYHAHFRPLEFALPSRSDGDQCFIKLVCRNEDGPGSPSHRQRVVGIHYLGPNAGEVVQGFGAALKLGATRADLEHTIGIHPTNAEELVKVHISKRSGKDPTTTGC